MNALKKLVQIFGNHLVLPFKNTEAVANSWTIGWRMVDGWSSWTSTPTSTSTLLSIMSE